MAVFTSSGSWTVPENVYTITVHCWGGGGGGGAAYGNYGGSAAGGAGGGGAYSQQLMQVLPGQVYTVTVGAGGIGGNHRDGTDGGTTTFTGIAGTCSAAPGHGGEYTGCSEYCYGLGGTGGSSGAGYLYKGGDGGKGNNYDYGGGGGGAAGSGSNGSNGGMHNYRGAGGTGTYPGGNGGTGGNNRGNGADGSIPGGGGGGAADNTNGTIGGAGARGEIKVTYSPCDLTITQQPASPPIICPGTATVHFTVAVSGGTSYQWQEYNGTSWANISNGGVYSNATTPTLTLTNPTYALNGYKYRCMSGCIH